LPERFDVAIVGAGAAGLFCAARAGQQGLRVLLTDHADRIAEKIRISGGGRCNFTNLGTGADNFISANPDFCRSALARYSPRDFIAMVERHGIGWHEKHKGQLFCDGSSTQIIDMLLAECAAGGVSHWQPCVVDSVAASPGVRLACQLRPTGDVRVTPLLPPFAQARDGFASCRNEAKASFGDDRVFIEKYIEQPRHIEIQVLGDAHGHCVYLWERECSMQRRHQKVIEEAPSAFVDEATRKAMGEQAVALARAVKYQSAGTVEFVVGKDRRFFFLEMNTRLQVEHPVTEAITGLDIVEQMIRVAAGEALAFTQEQVVRKGWAIECRINAEDVQRGFLPSTGRLTTFRPPAQTIFAGKPTAGEAGVRVDTGVYEGGEIPIHYDSMICKLIASASDRAGAIATMRDALDAFVIRGVASNIAFQAVLIGHPRFAAGDFDTGFIAKEFAHGVEGAPAGQAEVDFLFALAVAANRRLLERSAGISGQLPGHELQVGEQFVVVQTDAAGHRTATPASVRIKGCEHAVSIGERSHRIVFASPLRDVATHGTVDAAPFRAQIERQGLAYRISRHGAQITVRVLSPRAAELQALMPFKPPPDLSRFLLSPMPGLLVDVAVTPGQAVRVGERLAVIEAMKMENVVVAAHDGVVARVVAVPGSSLAVDEVILEFAAAEAAP